MGAKPKLQLDIRRWKMQTSNLVLEKTQPIVRSSTMMTTKGPQAMDMVANLQLWHNLLNQPPQCKLTLF